MNQILETKRIYVTPKLKRQKKLYKYNFFISVFLLCLIISYYVYTEYDKYKNEKLSRDILASIVFDDSNYSYNYTYKEPEKPKGTEDNPILIMVGEDTINASLEVIRYDQNLQEEYLEKDVGQYSAIAILRIPKLALEYPVLSRTTDELLKISPNKFWRTKSEWCGKFLYCRT